MNKTIPAFFSALTMAVSMSVSTPAFAIKKCKDADGNWHYGDVAVAQCNNAKVTTLSKRGFVESELKAPRTAEEIQLDNEKAAKEEEEKERLAELKSERERIFSIYETEEDIDRQRDNQLNSVQSNIAVHSAYLKNLDKRIVRYETTLSETKKKSTKEKITQNIAGAKARRSESEKNLEALEDQKIEIMERFEREKKVYLELKKPVN